jgi:hypothetical protein
MARRHWRFIVRDAYGYAIQNARVFVYQPGTSSDFTGTCHSAASGGSVLTNPFTTNAQGEVEGFFSDAQSVDVFVTDNTDQAYRAVDGPGATISFTSFTEVDEIDVTPSDVVLTVPVVGVTGDLVAAIVNPYTAVTAAMGASGEWADAAHTHPYAALTPSSPEKLRTAGGAGSGTDPAREDHVHAFMAAARSSAFALVGTTTSETEILSLNVPAGVMAAGSSFRVSMVVYVTNTTAATRVVTFRLRWGGVAGVLLGGALAITNRSSLGTDVIAVLDGWVTIRTAGATGTAVADMVLQDKLTSATFNISGTVITAAATIDTTASKDLTLTAQWTTSDANTNLDVDNVQIVQVA